jgi:mono/diheme cytochrome c family protein
MLWSAGRLRLGGTLMALGLGAVGLVVVPPASAETPAPPPRAPEAVYAKTCGYCHGQHVAPLIRGRSIPADMTMQIVRRGQRAMPAFRPTEISNAELKALAVWLKASKADPKEHGQ